MTPPLVNSAAGSACIANVLHPYTWTLKTSTREVCGCPVVITRGKGVRVWDDAGKDYIESVAGLWCASLGFDNERLVQAAVTQMRKLPFYHAFTAKSHEPMIDLAEMLIARAPVPMSKVFFANSGSEANDSAIKMVWYFNNALGREKKKRSSRPHQGLSRHHIGRGLVDRIAGQPSQLRCAAARLRAHDDAAFLSRRHARRDRGAVRHALRRRA